MITLNNITINYGSRVLFDKINLRVSGKERIGLIGANGAGKSTLLKIICNLQNFDSGNISQSRHTTVGYLPQEMVTFSGNSVFDEVYNSLQDIKIIQNEISEIEKDLQEASDKESEEYLDLVNEYSELQDKFHLLEGYKLNSKIEKILTGLGFKSTDLTREVDEFSGGWQMRIALAKLLLINPSILLLDEPTNHLDINSLLWLEDYLKNYIGAILIVSHDKKFLNNLTNRTIEIFNGQTTKYAGNYDFYVAEKAKLKQLRENQLKNQQKYIKEQEKFIERFRYKATKARAVQSRIKMLDKLDVIEELDNEKEIRFKFPAATHSGKMIIEVKNLSKSYDGQNYVLENIDLNISRGDKIAFLGDNGAGKSTLSRIIAGKEPFNAGSVKEGHMVMKKYFAQNQAEELNMDLSVLETIEQTSYENTELNLRKILGGFLFRDDDVYKKVGVLSGGEKSRLALAKMLIEPSNFLILDEPTNHLDISSKDILKNALKEYDGTIVIVSHDREFLDEIVTKVVEFENRKISTFTGNCSEYLWQKEIKKNNIIELDVEKQISSDLKMESDSNWLTERDKRREFNRQVSKLRKSIQESEHEISEAENRKKVIEDLMSDDKFYKDVNKVIEIKKEYQDILKSLSALNKKWEKDSESLIKIENSKNN